MKIYTNELGHVTIMVTMPIYSVSVRARFLRFDPVNSSVDVTKISECVFRDATKLPPMKCLKNPVNTLLSVKRECDISVLKYYTGIKSVFPRERVFCVLTL